MSRHVPQVPPAAVGMASGLEFAFEFLHWASAFRRPPHWREIAGRWQVDRATAYRYRAAYLRFLERNGWMIAP